PYRVPVFCRMRTAPGISITGFTEVTARGDKLWQFSKIERLVSPVYLCGCETGGFRFYLFLLHSAAGLYDEETSFDHVNQRGDRSRPGWGGINQSVRRAPRRGRSRPQRRAPIYQQTVQGFLFEALHSPRQGCAGFPRLVVQTK